MDRLLEDSGNSHPLAPVGRQSFSALLAEPSLNQADEIHAYSDNSPGFSKAYQDLAHSAIPAALRFAKSVEIGKGS